MFETLNPLLDVVNPEESILNASVPFVLAAIVSAAGKKMPVLVSPVGTMAGAAAVPVPVVTSVEAGGKAFFEPVVAFSKVYTPVAIF